MRALPAALLSVVLIASSAFAATETGAPLPAGKPAGAKEAALLGPSMFLVLLSAGIVIGGITLAVSNNGSNNGVTTPTTTSTSTTSLP